MGTEAGSALQNDAAYHPRAEMHVISLLKNEMQWLWTEYFFSLHVSDGYKRNHPSSRFPQLRPRQQAVGTSRCCADDRCCSSLGYIQKSRRVYLILIVQIDF